MTTARHSCKVFAFGTSYVMILFPGDIRPSPVFCLTKTTRGVSLRHLQPGLRSMRGQVVLERRAFPDPTL
jgi:hypothetical protein